MIGAFAKRLFGSANDRVVKSLSKTVDAVNALEPELEALSDVELAVSVWRPARSSTMSWSRPSPRCARRPSAPSGSVTSTSS
jgi:hypothetical protein